MDHLSLYHYGFITMFVPFSLLSFHPAITAPQGPVRPCSARHFYSRSPVASGTPYDHVLSLPPTVPGPGREQLGRLSVDSHLIFYPRLSNAKSNHHLVTRLS